MALPTNVKVYVDTGDGRKALLQLPLGVGSPAIHGDQAIPFASNLMASVTLTHEQILTVGTVPPIVVPAAGPGKVLLPHSALFLIQRGLTPYVTGSVGWGLGIGTNNSDYYEASEHVDIVGTCLISNAGGVPTFFVRGLATKQFSTFDSLADVLVKIANKPLILVNMTGSGDLTDGDDTDTATVIIAYATLDLSWLA